MKKLNSYDFLSVFGGAVTVDLLQQTASFVISALIAFIFQLLIKYIEKKYFNPKK